MKFLKTSRLNYTAETAMTKTCKEVQKKMKLTSDKTQHLAKMHHHQNLQLHHLFLLLFLCNQNCVCCFHFVSTHQSNLDSKHEKAITFLLLQDLPFICCFPTYNNTFKTELLQSKNERKISFPNALCLKITQNVAYEFLNFGISHQFLSY